MKKLAFGLFIAALVLTACTPPTPAPTDQPSLIFEDPGDGGSERTPAQNAALTLLAQTLGLPIDQIKLVATESVTWPDGCLGVQRPGQMCTQALVEGFKVTLETGGGEYVVHTNESGSAAVIASGLDENSLIELALIRQLAGNLDLNEVDVSVVSNEPVEFADSCLGVAMQDVTCAEVITPGRIVVLETEGVRYEYHTSEDGAQIQPATLVMTWSREGGIAGFCDQLTVFLSGEVYGNQCKSQPNGTMGTLAALLTPAERTEFQGWIAEYGSVTIDASDPKGVADGMTLILSLYGNGSAKPLKDVETELFTWAQELFQKLYE